MRHFLLLILLAGLSLRIGTAQDDEGAAPPIVITSPDQARTFAFGTVKEHALIWDKKNNVLIARIVFTDEERDGSQTSEDTQEFRLPGVTFDAAKGIFYATSTKGDVIPVAHVKKQLFMKVIETLPNAVVRIQHPRGRVTVILEALRPDDPALHAPMDAGTNSDGGRTIDLHDLIH